VLIVGNDALAGDCEFGHGSGFWKKTLMDDLYSLTARRRKRGVRLVVLMVMLGCLGRDGMVPCSGLWVVG
jgi:hypothetical protein